MANTGFFRLITWLVQSDLSTFKTILQTLRRIKNDLNGNIYAIVIGNDQVLRAYN